MPSEILDIPLQPAPAGTRRSLRVLRFGAADARPKAYVHAGLHADETPGLLAVRHLIRMLENAEANDAIPGQVVVVPYANPIGLAQFIHGEQSGRFDLATGSNFNRGWPDLAGAAAPKVEGRLGGDGDANAALIRRALHEALDALTPVRELDALRLTLAREACDADFVLDLHCDDEGLMHLFVMKSQWPLCRDLAGDLGCRAVLFADNAGRGTFMESLAAPWQRLAAQHPGHPIPQSCLSLTVELRGYADVSDELAAADAAALFRALQRRGMVAGNPGRPPDAPCEPAGLDACDIIRAPCSGIV
ncbi:MAG TPA: succinylglutamate desuccinylase/aspartoacylase family protein, partial [Arenicellales bacterium]|nr:succinylglutamate desuccinylase/aspartoacylase family protein [Arenicellales bacterium]